MRLLIFLHANARAEEERPYLLTNWRKNDKVKRLCQKGKITVSQRGVRYS